jgi:hypothetical protein
MTVRPTSFDDGTGMWTYVHDTPGGSHGGTLDPATVTYGTNMDGSDDLNVVVGPCPEGDAVSCWPPGGGADALMGQSLHVMVAMAPGLGREGKTAEQAAAEVKARVVATDGEERWVLDDQVLKALEATQA